MIQTCESTGAELVEAARAHLFPNYRQYPIVFTRGQDCRLWDIDGREYVDFVAGIATCNLGHSHPAVTEAIRNQAKELLHVSNWYYNLPQIELVKKLADLTFAERIFLCNSGAEANETAIKLARKRAYERHGPGKEIVVSLIGAFHGRTMKALTATDPKHHHAGFSPYPEGFVHIQPGDINALKATLPKACALFIEPVQGEGGVHPISPEFIRESAKLCAENDALMVMDEVQTGMGRCGDLFAYQVLGIEPDVLTLAKGLGNGFPIGAVLAREDTAVHMGPGSHGTTFGGNPLACAAANATLNELSLGDFPGKVNRMGNLLRNGLERIVSKFPQAVEVRGMGLLLGLELDGPAGPVIENLMKRGYLATHVAERTLRFTPPLTITEEDIQGLLDVLEQALCSLGETS